MGGGEALAKFLLAQKSKLTITDLRKRKILEPVIKRLGNNKIEFVLGKHREADFKKNDIIVFNPAVSIFSRWAKLAKRYKKPIENVGRQYTGQRIFHYFGKQRMAICFGIIIF
ncbi:MAG: UDP-N-acetylmuramoylalanine-D-glutamate ligase [Candidatus Azambacteria bacterium GW2011_GWA2_42_9]|uniref:UDP-N-acetylmuramoylalanine-D-glutamate ligase n=1 Tax=Candidatus Azambacteria bacterium GW2011_GWA2_42_9 TaxID=1618613 RepID=A0A0G1EN59_9BACT|nr:MAG: UDP-N-acetylmuramoylalanine-D-glutamate ligase [Candidatus Azambacteria bacterium GW2011_GWA2_42_9]